MTRIALYWYALPYPSERRRPYARGGGVASDAAVTFIVNMMMHERERERAGQGIERQYIYEYESWLGWYVNTMSLSARTSWYRPPSASEASHHLRHYTVLAGSIALAIDSFYNMLLLFVGIRMHTYRAVSYTHLTLPTILLV